MKPKKAIKELRRQLRSEPQNLVLRLRLAGCLCEVGEVREAVDLYYSVALAYRVHGRLSQAIAVCKSLLEIDPGHRETQAMLGELEVQRIDRESEEARLQARAPRPLSPPLPPPPGARRARNSSAPPPSRTGPSGITPRGRGDSLPPALANDSLLGRAISGSRPQLLPRPPGRTSSSTSVEFSPPSFGGRVAGDDEEEMPTRIADEAGHHAVMSPLPTPGDDDEEMPTHIADDPGEHEPQTRVAGARMATLPLRKPRRNRDVDTGLETPPLAVEEPPTPDDLTVVDDPARRVFASIHADTLQFGPGRPKRSSRPPPAGDLEARSTARLAVPRAPTIDGALLQPFADLAPAAVEELSRRAIERSVGAGETIIEEGQPGDSCFVVASGEVRVLKSSPLSATAEPVEVARLGEGELFGEFALLGDRRRHASVQALKASTLYEISRVVVLSLGRDHPQLQAELHRFYRQRMLETLLATAPFFAPLPKARCDDLRGEFSAVRAQPGQRIIREGERSGGFYLVLLGAVEIKKRAPDGSEVAVARLGEGGYFGELSLLRGDIAQASVVAVGPTELAVLPPRRFYALVAANPVLWSQVRDEASRREIETHSIVAGITASV